jgi:hypothetical protein
LITLHNTGTSGIRYSDNIDFTDAVYTNPALDTEISPLPDGVDGSSPGTNQMKRTISEARSKPSNANIKTGLNNLGTYTALVVGGVTVI